MTTSKLAGSRILVIGGSSGVGFGVAKALVASGASVTISSSSANRITQAVQNLQEASGAKGVVVKGYTCDLGSQYTLDSEIASLFGKVSEDGKLDHVVYTAGDSLCIGEFGSFSTDQAIQAGMVRFFAPLSVAKHLKEHMKSGAASSFVMTTGLAGDHPPKGWSLIAPYLAGLHGMTRSLAVELAPIRVNIVNLGAVETELWDGLKATGAFEGFKKGLEEKMLTQQLGIVDDVSETYLYLMKNHNSSGSSVITDGGALLM